MTTLCPPDHSHGQKTTCYTTHRCRCEPCTRRNTARQTTRRKLIAYDRYDSGFVDAEPVRQHVNALRDQGLGLMRASMVSGISYGVFSRLMYGKLRTDGTRMAPSIRISAAHAAAILAISITPEILAPTASYTALGVQRRLQALCARGWALSMLAPHLGITAQRVQQYMHLDTVAAATHLRIAGLYEQLWNQEPPQGTWNERRTFRRTVNHAAACRWVPPLGWNDIDTDPTPPVAERDHDIDEIAVELACAGEKVRLTSAERREVVKTLHPRKWSDPLIAAHADCDTRTVERIRDELGLEAFDQTELIRRTAA